MSHDFIDDLLQAVGRVVTPDAATLKELLIINGMPGKTANLRYLSFNRQTFSEPHRTRVFSAVAVINNRRVEKWRLEGYRKKISQIIFNPRLAFNPMDLFINNLRCHDKMTEILATAKGYYTLLGMLNISKIPPGVSQNSSGLCVRPVIAVPHLDPAGIAIVTAFESANEVRETRIGTLPLYHRSR